MPKTIHHAHDYELEVRRVVAKRLKQARKQLGITRIQLAEPCDIRWQMIQKYENAKSRISVERLCHLATVLHTPLDMFLGDLGHDGINSSLNDDPLVDEVRRLNRSQRRHLKLLLRLWK